MNRELKNKLTLKLLDDYPQLTSAAFGRRMINGSYSSNEEVIVLSVSSKKPISELNEEDVLPSEITFEGFTFSTDVIQLEDTFQGVAGFPTGSLDSGGSFDAINGGFAPGLPADLNNPIEGGIRINNSDNAQSQGNTASFGVGTLGTLAVDNASGDVVALTNAHVVGYENDYRIDGTNTDRRVINNKEIRIDTHGTSGTGGDNIVGRVWRVGYQVIQSIGNNNIDAAVIALRQGVFNSTSTTQLNLTGFATSPEWATTAELNGILSTDPLIPLVVTRDVFHSGGRTGAKGQGNPRLRITAANVAVRMSTMINGVSQTVRFIDGYRVEAFDNTTTEFLDDAAPWGTPCNGVSNQGDSGSAIHAEVETSPGVFEIKLIGLLFSGPAGDFVDPADGMIKPDRTRFTMCRIDHIANELNVSRWNGTDTDTIINATGTGTEVSIVVAGEQNQVSIAPGDTLHPGGGDMRTYYRAGLTTDATT